MENYCKGIIYEKIIMPVSIFLILTSATSAGDRAEKLLIAALIILY